jgi:transposase InsO family protein
LAGERETDLPAVPGEGLIVGTKQRKKMARRERSPQPLASRPNQCWSMDFVTDKLADGSTFRILTVVISSRASAFGWKRIAL